MSKTALPVVRTESAPTTELDTRPEPKRPYLTESEVELLIKAAESDRDRCMILMAYTHGLRVSELIHLRWSQLDLDAGRIRVLRSKMGADSEHPLRGREIRLLRKLRRVQPVGSRFVFATGRGAPMTRNGFYKLFRRAGETAGVNDCHPHRLRHGAGYRLVNQGMDTLSLAAYLGHKNVQNTQRYARMSATRFDGLWND
jgi:integrase